MSARPVCVQCRLQPADPRWRPFCSERCQLADLNRWLQGDYRVPGPAIDSIPDSPDNDPST
ncbi:MAG: DNA gyrase inhibitor YacG [Acidobacteria bacterium]|nr:DNA gyrase inhibitor YacG [Acidobacteriota bacterium]MBK9241602.1 DNA gyrase inhibitor YacG [Acidobacteriota bacterium]